MLRKRLIFILYYSKGYFMQSRNFNLQRVGDIVWLENNYNFIELSRYIDELIILKVSPDNDEELFYKSLRRLAQNIFIPISAGGGIRNLDHAKMLFNNGADKLVLNSPLYTDYDLIDKIIKIYGSQSIIASIDYKMQNQNKKSVFIENGEKKIDYSLKEYLDIVIQNNVGEILLNSIDRDGTGFGLDIDNISNDISNLKVPIIISGGAGNETHLESALKNNNISAVATGNLFNFIGDGLINARLHLEKNGINLAIWDRIIKV